MDARAIEAHAIANGFERAVALFRDDVLEAARRAALQRAQLDPPEDPTCEPWPPMICPPPR